MTQYRLLVSNASAVLAGRLVAIALGVVLATTLFLTLGPEQYGIWSLLTLISGYSTLVDFGLSSAVERRIAMLAARDARADIPGTISTTLLVVVCLVLVAEGAMATLLASSMLATLGADLRRALLLLPACTGLSVASLVLGAVLAGEQRHLVLHAWRSLGLAVGTLSVVAMVRSGFTGLDVLLVVYTAGSLVTMFLTWQSLRGTLRGPLSGVHWDRDAARELWSFGGTVQVATMVPPLAEYVFRLLVGTRFGVEFAGVYDLGARAAIVPRSLAGAMFSAMIPFAVQTDRRQGTTGIVRLMETTTRHVALFILPGSAVLLAFSNHVVRLWLGDGTPLLLEVQRCFEVVLIAHALGAVAVPAAMVSRALGRPRPEATAAAVSFTAAVAAAPFVPSFAFAAGLLWLLPALGGAIVSVWLSRTLGRRLVKAGDLLGAAAAATLVFLAARALADWPAGVPVVARIVAASIVAVLAAAAIELTRAGRGHAMLRSRRGTP